MPYPIGNQADRFVVVEITSDNTLRVHKGKAGAKPSVSNDVKLKNVGGSVTFDVILNPGSSATVALEAMAWPDDYGDVEIFMLGEGRPFDGSDLQYIYGPQAAGKLPDLQKRFVFTPGLLKHQGSNFSQGKLGGLAGAGTPAFTGQLELAPLVNAGVLSYLVAVRVGTTAIGKIQFSTDITFVNPASVSKIVPL